MSTCKQKSNCATLDAAKKCPSIPSKDACAAVGMLFVDALAKSSRHRGHKAYCAVTRDKAARAAEKLAIKILPKDECEKACHSWIEIKHGSRKGVSYCRPKSSKRRKSHKKSEKRSLKKKCKRSGKVWVKRNAETGRKSYCRKH